MEHSLFSPAKQKRTQADWLVLLTKLKNELAIFLQMEIDIVGVFIPEQDLEYASYGVALDIIVKKDISKNEEYGGVICISMNYEEAVWIDAFLLEFHNKKRAEEHLGEVLSINFDQTKGWNDMRWQMDEYGEWVSYKDMSRWEGHKHSEKE